MTIDAYPLSWPHGWRRTPAADRKRALFHKRTQRGDSYPIKTELSISQATQRVLHEMNGLMMCGDDIIISSNVELRRDGLPRSGRRAPEDPGAAVYWPGEGEEMRVIAVDHYDRVADNLAAIAATLEYMRGIERHGGAQILKRVFTGFAALPAPGAAEHWSRVLNTGKVEMATLAEVERNFRTLVKLNHPDHGGDGTQIDRLRRARDEARRHFMQRQP